MSNRSRDTGRVYEGRSEADAANRTIGICPPSIIEEEQIEELIQRLRLTLDDALLWSQDNM